MLEHDNIIFFDGVCNLCNHSVNILLKLDSKKILKFSTLQGSSAQTLLDLKNPNDFDSVIFYSQGQIYKKSEAFLKILKLLGGFYQLTSVIISILPYSLLDYFYDLIAKNRYKIFGNKEACRVPRPEEKNQFID